jgi:putative hydrolase of the HAD superfamily
VLSELRAAGVTIGLCSNWDWDLETELVDLGLAGAFDLVITSARAGARKPHERIYRYALEQLGTDPERVLFVGDTLIADIQGPMRAGMRAAYLHRAGARGWPGWSGFDQAPAQLPSLPAGVPLIGDLTGVLPLLDLPPKPASAQHR